MADESQLKILLQGASVWNKWRKATGDLSIDLVGADLLGADLGDADLRNAVLFGADLRHTNLFRADLSGAELMEADLSDADLREANLSGGNLVDVSFRSTDLRAADLSATLLRGAQFHWTALDGANLSMARLRETVFSFVRLSRCNGLETCIHAGPSSIDMVTLQASGSLPLSFLRGLGLPDLVIEYMPSLLNRPIQHYSCFISYSASDGDFARRLHADLQDKGVRCWFAPEDMKIGAKILDALDEAIRLRDKLLIVLSENSIASEWVEDEVTKAFAEERNRRQVVLFPIRIDQAIFATNEAWATKLRNNRNIGDFQGWKDHDTYQRALARLLRDLRVDQSRAFDDSV